MTFVSQAGNVRFILVDPSHDGNIGASSRAINTMGFDRLYVVNPRDRDYKNSQEAIALSTHSVNVLSDSVMTDSLQEALEGVDMAFALSGYDREFGPPMVSLVGACEETKQLVQDNPKVQIAFVFGTERSGLTNEQIGLCQRCVGIPANPECDSLNLSQAVQVTAYQLQMTLRGPELSKESRRFEVQVPAKTLAVDRMLEHLKQALIACGALDEKKPKFMMERFRHMFLRTNLTQSEVDMLHGFIAAVICPKDQRKGTKKLKKEN